MASAAKPKADKPKPRGEQILPFPDLDSKNLSQAPIDQGHLRIIKRRYLAFAVSLGPEAQRTIVDNLSKVKANPSNQIQPSGHTIWKQSQWNTGHWILLSSIYDDSKLSLIKARLNCDLTKFNDPGPVVVDVPEELRSAVEGSSLNPPSAKRPRGDCALPKRNTRQKLSDKLGRGALEYAQVEGTYLFNCSR